MKYGKTIEVMKKEHAKTVANIHFTEFKNAFLCDLGKYFLQKLYEGMVLSKDCVGYVYIEDEQVVGFITGSKNMDLFFKPFMFKNFFVLSAFIFFAIVKKPYLVRNIIETLFYSGKSKIKDIDAELISIAVKKEYSKRGIGGSLFKKLVDYFRDNNISKFKLIVDKDNETANNFYKKLGFKFEKEFVMYKKKMNLYTYRINFTTN